MGGFIFVPFFCGGGGGGGGMVILRMVINRLMIFYLKIQFTIQLRKDITSHQLAAEQVPVD